MCRDPDLSYCLYTFITKLSGNISPVIFHLTVPRPGAPSGVISFDALNKKVLYNVTPAV